MAGKGAQLLVSLVKRMSIFGETSMRVLPALRVSVLVYYVYMCD